MLKIKLRIQRKSRIFFSTIFLFLFFSTLLLAIINNNINLNGDYNNNQINQKNDNIPKNSAVWGILNLTNSLEVNNTRHYHNETIQIIGELLNGTLDGIPGYTVAIEIDENLKKNINDTTDGLGVFKINFTIPFSLNIYSSHKIEVDVLNPPDTVNRLNYYIINVNATSYFDVDSFNRNSPQLAGGYFDIPSFLRYDNNSGIPNQTINSIWYNESLGFFVPPNAPFNTNSDGSFKIIPIPDDNVSNILFLDLTYNGNSTYINGTQELVSVKLYRNITCVWNTTSSATEGNTITIKGQLFARNNSNLVINYTEVRLEFVGGASIGTNTTVANGIFYYRYQIPLGTIGNRSIQVRLLNFSNVFSNTTHFISIASVPIAPITPGGSIGDGDKDTPPPFQNFFMIFIPIIIGIAAALIIFAYFHLRKQKEEALIVKLPLEDRIRNLKILKDTGRLEEALSYLFQSIYIELINAKYGRRKKENETIRDFAIISVKELKLNPASIYPFIQNVEKIIYDKPFIIKEQDFYASVELFSPIYFELTGYQFILNF
jgi:hypothetical protein